MKPDERVPSPAPTAQPKWKCNGCACSFADDYSAHSHSVETKHSFSPSKLPAPDPAAELAREIAAKSWDNEEEAAVWIEKLLRERLGEHRPSLVAGPVEEGVYIDPDDTLPSPPAEEKR